MDTARVSVIERKTTGSVLICRLFFAGAAFIALAFFGWGTPTRVRAGAINLTSQDSTYEEELQNGWEALRRHKYEDALKSFKRANDLREKKCGECFFGMAQAYNGLEAYKNVITSSDKAIELAANDAKLQAQANNLKGLALQSQSDNKDQKKLQEAEAAFRQGLTLDGKLAVLHYNLGFVLMQQNRDPEGGAEMKKYLEMQPRGSFADSARQMIENPRRSREPFAPSFSFTTADGEFIELDDLRGKVVVLDFWGTWCPPCVESVPSLRSLHKKYSKEPSFVLIGVSSDSEDDVWRDFIGKNQMVWPQYRDRDHKILRAFDIRAFPTYIVIDHEGIIRFRSTGVSWLRAANLEDAIRKQVKIVAKTSAAN
jgi:peroxiredoxin